MFGTLSNMESILGQLKMEIDPGLYIKNPDSSSLGKKIVTKSVELLEEVGLEDFNFKKLAAVLETTESSIYRYFKNKHQLLFYLIDWYWCFLEYRLVFAINNISDKEEKLRIVIELITKPITNNISGILVNVVSLNKLVVSESVKVYFTKLVDEENKQGLFKVKNRICERIAKLISECNPNYEHPLTLATTIIEGAQYHLFFAQHLPSLNNINTAKDNTSFFMDLTFKTIKQD